MRKPIVAGNWKMNLGDPEEALAFVRQIRPALNAVEGIDRVLCPPFTALAALAEVLAPSQIHLGAQTMHWEESGAHTGEISPTMLTKLCDYVILGHSERRATQSSSETDASINRKVLSAFHHGLTPIICVGEDEAQNEAGKTQEFVGQQVCAALDGLTSDQVQACVMAYEPIWAIGTGKAATPADANRTIGLTVRGTIAEVFGEDAAKKVRVQYGGSVNAGNIADFVAMPEIDGALVGGASLTQDFVLLVQRAVI
jgi:triosephosphate isomerase